MSFVERRLAYLRKVQPYFEDPEEWARRILRAGKRLLGEDCRVFLFGSVVKGEAHPGTSDIDLLVVYSGASRRAREMVKVEMALLEEAGIPPEAPFEIHLASPELLEEWFRPMAKELREVS